VNCPTCDYPMVWSLWHERIQCSVYGDHLDHRGHHPAVAAVLDHEEGRTPLRLVREAS
jgi:hypothetical protein